MGKGGTLMKFLRLSAGCYVSSNQRIEINKLPDGYWAWAIDGIGYDAEPTLRQAKIKAIASLV